MATPSSKSTTRKRESNSADAIALLTADHKAVKALFKQFEALTEQEDVGDQKAHLVKRICDELTIHAQIEEEVFYPAVRAAIDDDALMDEADIEHASAKDLIAQLEGMEPGDDHYDARVTVLGEYIEHHVKEEEGEIFDKARKADVDIKELGEQIAARKDELKSELGIGDEEDDEDEVQSMKTAQRTEKARETRR